MKRKLMFLSLAAIGFASCNGGFKQGDAGLLYNIHTSKGGAHIKEGDFMSVNMVIKTDGDSVLVNTYDVGHPTLTPMPKPQSKGDIYAGIELLGEGDSATFKISTDSIFKKGAQRPPGLKGKFLVFQVKIEKVIAKGSLTEQVFRGRIEDYQKTLIASMKSQEPAKIAKYIADHNLKLTKTKSGLNYVITSPGSGPTVAIGDTAVIKYAGRLLSGKVFDTNIKEVFIKEKVQGDPNRPFDALRIPVGAARVIPGWDEGLQLMTKGSKAIFVIPSDLAYKEQGIGPIGPFTPIMFDMELVDIVHPNPNAPKPVVPQMMPQAQQGPPQK
jgi:FKBP-type peptidyl-prolyl cis-trans isomerase